MIEKILNRLNYLSLTLVCSVLTGCNGGDSSTAGPGGASFFADSVTASTTTMAARSFAPVTDPTVAGNSFATIHNPEPATMILLGGGMMAAAFYKNMIK